VYRSLLRAPVLILRLPVLLLLIRLVLLRDLAALVPAGGAARVCDAGGGICYASASLWWKSARWWPDSPPRASHDARSRSSDFCFPACCSLRFTRIANTPLAMIAMGLASFCSDLTMPIS